MSPNVKSALYFASFVLALVTYYSIGRMDGLQQPELAQNTTVQASRNTTLN